MRNASSAIAALLCASVTSGCRQAAVPAPPPPQRVKVALAREADSGRELRLSGTIEAERSSSLGFAVPGTVESVLVQEGEQVRAGQPLARLTRRSYEDALGIARARLAQAEDAHRRLEPMHRNRTVPEIKWVEVETGLEQARLALSMAQKSVDDTVLRAPEPGIVARRSIEPGSTALPGVPALVLVQTRTVLATAPVPETQVASVRKGQPAQVAVGALGRTFEGAVREVAVVANPLTRTYTVKVALQNREGDLRLGMVSEVLVRQESALKAVVVPPAAVRIDEAGRPCAYVVESGGRLRRRAVEVTGYVGEAIALAKGVAVGESVVVSGSPMLADGMRVQLADAAETVLAKAGR